MRRRTVIVGLLGLVALVAAPGPTRAFWASGSIVNDPLNTAQGTLTAARSLISNQNEVRILTEQLHQIAQDAKHLMSLPLSVVNDLQRAMDRYTALIQDGRSTIGQIKAMSAQFEQLYASGWGGNADMMTRAKLLLGKVREAGAFATQANALYDRITGQQATVNRLLVASQVAPGSLAAQQATNQLLGTLAEQQVSLQALMAAQGEVQQRWILTQVVSAEQAAAQGVAQQIDVTRYLGVKTLTGTGPRLPR
jgi:P-type conjugative transfer protein TrbJ